MVDMTAPDEERIVGDQDNLVTGCPLMKFLRQSMLDKHLPVQTTNSYGQFQLPNIVMVRRW